MTVKEWEEQRSCVGSYETRAGSLEKQEKKEMHKSAMLEAAQ